MKSETTEEWIKRIGTSEAHAERVKLRLTGKLNAPIRGVYGIANLAAIISAREGTMRSTFGHAWSCQCELCRPWLYEDKPEPKVTKIEPTKPMKEPRKKWDSQNRGRSSN